MPPRFNIDIKRGQLLEILPAARLREIIERYQIKTNIRSMYHVKRDLLANWSSAIHADICALICELTK